jgi:hypothetical protein
MAWSLFASIQTWLPTSLRELQSALMLSILYKAFKGEL